MAEPVSDPKLAGAVRVLREYEEGTGTSFAGHIRTVLESLERLKAELAEANKTIDDMVGMEPCPKCGTGISATCLGCKLAAANVRAGQASERENQLREALEKIANLEDSRSISQHGRMAAHVARAALSPIPATEIVLKSRG